MKNGINFEEVPLTGNKKIAKHKSLVQQQVMLHWFVTGEMETKFKMKLREQHLEVPLSQWFYLKATSSDFGKTYVSVID